MNIRKLTIGLSVLALVIVASCTQPNKIVQRVVAFDESESAVRFMTYNIRYGTANDGPNSWPYRKELVFDAIADHKADIIGLQEALDFQINEIEHVLPQYKVVWTGRDDGEQAGEACPIFYRWDRFTLLDSGTFWFSNMPWKPGSKHWGNELPRICTWVRLRETATRKHFYVYNLHLDHASQESRWHSTQLLARQIGGAEHADPVVVMGDFNMDLDNPAMDVLRQINRSIDFEPMVDVWGLLNKGQPPVTTYQGFGKQPDGPCVDHILIEQSTEIIEAAIDARHYNDRYPSDHFPVIAQVKF